ncbi:hypothetical protein SLEP1_g9887 [Rubroshorea leprosula]|uniref:Uncharacterized protein n=1 Tax=Rubroshorea leprosula TaxID=152421 RepID=A0AAV5IC15_9ROSI|nr:hypothetical protein SLEP1_g9887 [Rubroshorea leprosula]
MDAESSPSPSSSDRTVEGVRGDEVVEVGGDSVPITVVEVEGRGERVYDVGADIVEEVKQYRSELGTRDSLGHLVENYEISSRVLVRPAGVEERACSAPRDHWMPVYAHYLLAGLRFPIPELLVDDTEWEREDTEVRELASWKTKRANQNKFSLNEDEKEEMGKLEVVPTTSAEAEEVVPQLKRKGWEERRALQKKKKVVEEEERGSEVPQFVSQPPPVELNPKLKESEEGAEVRAPGKGKGPVPPFSFKSSLFEAKNMTGARRFINTTFPEVNKRNARDEALRYCGASVVKHVFEEFMESVKERSLLQRQCDQLQKEKEELEKKNKELQKELNEEAYVELKKNVQLLVHNGMKEHISNFLSHSSFDDIVNLYRLPTAIIAFTDCRKKVKIEHLEVDITKITFEEQEEGVEENGESMSADFRPQIKLRWDHDADGRTIFPPHFDFEFVAVEDDEAEVEEDKVEAKVEGTEVDESQPVPEVEVHPVPSDDE